LIRQNSEGKGHYFNVDGKRKVTKEIFLYGLLKLKEQALGFDQAKLKQDEFNQKVPAKLAELYGWMAMVACRVW
jgi:hypothetical protein